MAAELESRLLNLPAELRLNIWEYLLAPKLDEAQWTTNNTAITPISRMCSISEPLCVDPFVAPRSQPLMARSHLWEETNCKCFSRPFYIVDSKERLGPTILRVNKQIYNEALPSLYHKREFVADPNRVFVCLHERISESWFQLDRFLAGLSAIARSNIHHVSVPMLLSHYEVYGCRDAFHDISSKLPVLKKINFEVAPSSYRDHWREDTGLPSGSEPGTNLLPVGEYWLGPMMTFADADISITAVDKHDLGPVLFERVKVAIEIRVFNQLLRGRIKRSQRRMARIRGILEQKNDMDEGFGVFEIHGMDGF